ncbi:melanocortin-2 receptor accessory protein 2A-like [Salvelinus sp. IW2-2015]|uniref:melanocortin-2 receptor accessory protein 2A-like n=1 Tax=Salvelinus sp. IW2-2015 TaxID=2691554 RepID=UPI000CDF67E5|nr:melanocortin-2 receptor accessory protein 2A-like [Salvelinus alpinus]
MSEIHNNYNQSRPSITRGSDYVWQYEYYDDDEPVSFEGLKAHRYSIVIGFWVGLAVFVVFMFFVLTLLTKTGAPHQENPELCEKRHRLGNCVVDIRCPQGDSLADEDKAFSRPLLDESRSFFYISKEKQGRGGAGSGCGPHRVRGRLGGRSSFGLEEMGEAGEASERGDGGIDLQGLPEEGKSEREHSFLSHHFDIPNFVNSEHSSMMGEDDLLLCEPPVLLDSQSCGQDGHHVIS